MANVIVINPFEVPKGQESQALAMWDEFAEYFHRQPGYVSAKLHRAINPYARFHLVTVAEWAAGSLHGCAEKPGTSTHCGRGHGPFPEFSGVV